MGTQYERIDPAIHESAAIPRYGIGMAIERANRSERLHESFWLRSSEDPLERILQRVDAWGGSVICPFRLPGRAAGADVAFELTPLPMIVSRERSIAFSWRHQWGTPLPSLMGTITASRFGPFANLLVSAEYAYADDPAGRLAYEAIGEECARLSAQCLIQFLRTAFPATRARARRVS